MASFHPPPRPQPKSQIPKSWYEEMLESDEILLYITAALGVILPGIVYLIYQRAHAFYMTYAAKKEAERRAEEAAKCDMVLLRLGSSTGPASRFISQVGKFVEKETTVAPKEWNSENMKTTQLSSFRGIITFVTDPSSSDDSAWLLDWMEEIAADSKAKKRAKFDDIRFAVVGFSSTFDDEKDSKVVKTIARRMKILGSKQLLPVALFQEPLTNEIFTEWCDMFLDEVEKTLEQHESEVEEEATSESEVEEETSREQKKDL